MTRVFALLLMLSACGGGGSSASSASVSVSHAPIASAPTINPTPAPAWSIGPVINGRDYSAGASVNGNVFTIPPQPNSLHYVTQPLSLAGKSRVTLRYTVSGETSAITAPGSPAYSFSIAT